MRKRLPDCPVQVEVKLSMPLFSWANRAGVKITRKSDALLRLRPTVVAVRDYLGDDAVSAAGEGRQTAFVDYSGGCGDFVVEDWLNTNKVPFERALRRFGSFRSLTVNEIAVLELWESCHHPYRAMGGL